MRGPHRRPRPGYRAHNQRNGKLPPGHIPDLGGVIDNLVHRQQAEINRHQLHHRTQPRQRSPHAGADYHRLRQRRILNPMFAVLLREALGYGESPPVGANVLAHQKNALVFVQSLAQRG